MKSVLISIQPKWCELIASGKKTVEVRKTAPKLETPFKIYIYCTQSRKYSKGRRVYNIWLNRGTDKRFIGNGKVIGSFVCDKVDTYDYHKGLTKFGGSLGLPIGTYDSYLIFEDDYKAMCLTYDEVKEYGNGKTLYGFHISQLKIYDKPKELGEFEKYVKDGNSYCGKFCFKCSVAYEGKDFNQTQEYKCPLQKLTRPPQSWCYVEGLTQ